MNKIKVIDLLNMISKGEEVPNFIIGEVEYYMGANGYLRECMGDDAQWYIDKSWLNTEARILEEPKGIPKKLYHCCMETDNEETKFLIKNMNDLVDRYNELLDYLESEGE